MTRGKAGVEAAGLESGASAPDAVRRDAGGRVVVAGRKARQTRRSLMEAAAELFVEQGFQGTAVVQIADRAGVSLGAFYQYFRNRGEVLTAMLHGSLRAMTARTETRWDAGEGLPGLERIIANYLRSYVEGGRGVAVWETVSHTEPEIAEARRSVGRTIRRHIETELLRAGRRGQVRSMTRGEAALSARALTGMIDRFCFDTYVFDPPDQPPSPEEAARILAALWAGGVGLSGPL